MSLNAHFYKHTLNFRFDAGTSRGVLKKKDSYFIKIYDSQSPETFGIGEAGPLFGLSLDFETAEIKLKLICDLINGKGLEVADLESIIESLDSFSSVKFALETALLNFKSKQTGLVFNNSFFEKSGPIAINGLIWMGDLDFMQSQIKEKINEGYSTIKLKIGAIDFEEELRLIKGIRSQFSENEMCIRVDANGAFSLADVEQKLHLLSDLQIHSIEQPIKAGQHEAMARLCEKNILPIALDEELIPNYDRKEALLNEIKPQFIILKPSLMGGLSGSKDWINTAENLNIDWWMTSALESNVGLNAICQFCAEFKNPLPQGLGTGKIYTNNFESPLIIQKGEIFYDKTKDWDLDFFNL
jgi:o-succinylbenzoate synthase